MEGERIEIRLADERDRRPLAHLLAAVAEERDGVATEPLIDVEERDASWRLDDTLVAVAVDEAVGTLHVEQSQHRLRRDPREGTAQIDAGACLSTTRQRSGCTGRSDLRQKAAVRSRSGAPTATSGA